jgi:amino acid adenylation domain-containing protein
MIENSVSSGACAPLEEGMSGDYPRNSCTHQLFEMIARQSPDRSAILVDGSTLSYRELDERSNQLARQIQMYGVGTGDIVGIHAYRSPETIITILAVLKCGAAYLPLDPAYPAESLDFMVRDAAPVVILEHRSLVKDGAVPASVPTKVIEDELSLSRAQSSLSIGTDVSALDIAYIMYTSGSTGRPKGVMVTHRGIVRLVRDQNYAQFLPDDVFLHVGSLSFDASTFEIWGALLNGAGLAIVPDVHSSLDHVAQFISRHGVTAVLLTTGMFHLFVDHKIEAFRSLRMLIAGGDVLSPVHVKRVVETLPHCQFINCYGPTENAVFTCCYGVPPEGWGEGSVPIGWAISHTSVYILDDQMHPVADGQIGQLCTGGDGVALGYLNRPELTQKAFIRDPFSDDPEARLYLTGDQVVRRVDGLIEFVGRTDRQVKINGKRIELDEIENILRRDEALDDAIVMIKVQGDNIKRIVAYLKPVKFDGDVSEASIIGDVLQEARANLPGHMVPVEFALVEHFPLTANGKVDRKQLQNLQTRPVSELNDGSNAAISSSEVKNDLEQALLGIWTKALRVEKIGREDNFFDLGGTSLQLTQIHVEIQQQLEGDLTLINLFEHPNIKDLAVFMGRDTKVDDTVSAARSRASRRGKALSRIRKRKAGAR